mmetsp:Transcript_19736/g.42780  ORF Transcript_19736/g.42780 Transcript_19736/m.42780 type:complete len:640 (+) Transcript_19736:93-2012(+)
MGSSQKEARPMAPSSAAEVHFARLTTGSATPIDKRDLSWATRMLGVTQQTTMTAVHQAFRKLAFLVHPDKNQSSTISNDAFRTLSDAFAFFKEQHAQAKKQAAAEREREEYQRRAQEDKFREQRAEARQNLLDISNQNCLYINVRALEKALSRAYELGVSWETIESAKVRLGRAKAAQQNAACEAAGGANLQSGGERAQAVRVEQTSNTDEYFSVGLFNCHCGQDHVWALESRGPTGSTPFGPGSSITPIPGEAGVYASDMLEAVHVMEKRYLEYTGLEITQATEHWSKRRGQWSSLGKQAIQMPGYEIPQVVWQFQRTTAADGYGPGWHNFRSDPVTGVDSSSMVERLYQTELRWQDLGSSQSAMSVNESRDVRSGKFAYRLTFLQPLNPTATMQGHQTNTKTKVKRNVRRLGVGTKCVCSMCKQPGAFPQAPDWSQPAQQPIPAAANAWKNFQEPPPPGSPPAEVHHALLQLLRASGGGLPPCWTRGRDDDELPQVHGKEAELVQAYLQQTLGHSKKRVVFGRISRVQNEKVWKEFRTGGVEKLMFHGCKSSANELSILAEGFQVGRCVSGGSNYGTWFAHVASYSDGGYAFTDSNSWRHLFICLVTNLDIKKENEVMRVVGQSCAYPAWIVRYKHC